jgi:hypothetical protein
MDPVPGRPNHFLFNTLWCLQLLFGNPATPAARSRKRAKLNLRRWHLQPSGASNRDSHSAMVLHYLYANLRLPVALRIIRLVTGQEEKGYLTLQARF